MKIDWKALILFKIFKLIPIPLFQFKVSKGVNINCQDKRGNTPLILACQYGQQGMVAFLVGRGAKLDTEDQNGDTCLHWAAYKGYPDLTRLLIGNYLLLFVQLHLTCSWILCKESNELNINFKSIWCLSEKNRPL